MGLAAFRFKGERPLLAQSGRSYSDEFGMSASGGGTEVGFQGGHVAF